MRFYKYIFLALLFVGTMACTDEDKFKNEVFFELERGGFVRFVDAFNPLIGTTDPAVFEYNPLMEDVNGNLSSYDLYIIGDIDGDNVNDTTIFNSYTDLSAEFPLNLTSANIAATLNRDVSSFEYGETFRFIATATRSDGVVFGNQPLTADFEEGVFVGNTQENRINEPGYRDAMDFDLVIACPTEPDVSSYPGTYTVVQGGWFETGVSVNLVAGPGENQITIQNLSATRRTSSGTASGTADFTFTINSDQTVSFEDQPGWTHSGFGALRMRQSSTGNFTFQCANNRIILRMNAVIPDGRSFGAVRTVLELQ